MTGAQLIPMISIGLASNLDNAGVGIAYGVRNIKISALASTVIAFMGFALTLLGGLGGHFISSWLSPLACNVIGMIILVAIGTWVILQPLISKKANSKPNSNNIVVRILRNPETADMNGSKAVDFKESVILGIALSINNLAGGFDAGITHSGIWGTAFFSGLFSFICIGICTRIGHKIAGERLGKSSSVIAGVILIAIGVHQVF